MASEMSSLIRFYLNSSTPTSSNHALNPGSPSNNFQPSSQSISADIVNRTADKPNISNKMSFKKLEDLPTPLGSTALDDDINKNIVAESKTSGSSSELFANSMFSTSMRLFGFTRNLKVNRSVKETEIICASAISTPVLLEDEENGPIDVITDSPIEDLLCETFPEPKILVKEEPKREEIDPIFDAYVRYVYHQQDLDSGDYYEDLQALPTLNDEIISDTTTVVDEVNHGAIRTEPAIENDITDDLSQDTLNANEDVILPQPLENLPRTSTLSRIKSKTKHILKQLSKHYDNDKKIFQENSQKAKIDLKRRLSTVSLKGHSSGQEWNWSRRRKSISASLGFFNSYNIKANTNQNNQSNNLQNFSNEDELKLTDGKRGNLMELFQSPNFAQRLQEGIVNPRKRYNDHYNVNEEDESLYDENYHISYKFNHEETGDNSSSKSRLYFGPKRTSSIQDFARNLFNSSKFSTSNMGF